MKLKSFTKKLKSKFKIYSGPCTVDNVIICSMYTLLHLQTCVFRLKKELEGANDLIMANKRRELSHEELSELCPSAALTSKFIKSGMTLTQVHIKMHSILLKYKSWLVCNTNPNGMQLQCIFPPSFFQIYSQYVEQTDELIVAKEENKRLNEAMDSILNVSFLALSSTDQGDHFHFE